MTKCSSPSMNVFPHLLIKEPKKVEMTKGMSVAQALLASEYGFIFSPGVRSTITLESGNTSKLIKLEDAKTTFLKEGETLNVRIIPTGGDDGKNPLAQILSLVVMVVAYIVAPYAGAAMTSQAAATAGTAAFNVASAVAGAAIMALGSIAVSAIAPPQTTDLSGSSTEETSQLYSITGSSNRANAYGPLPFMIGGEDQIFPVHIAEPWTEVLGEDEYLNCRFGLIGGNLDRSGGHLKWEGGSYSILGGTREEIDRFQFKLGDTALEDYTDIELQWTVDSDITYSRPTLYSNGEDISQDRLSAELTKSGGQVTRSTQTKTTKVSFDVTLPRGLVLVDSEDGERSPTSVVLSVSIVDKVDGEVVRNDTISIYGKYTSVVRFNYEYEVPEGHYDVKWDRVTADSSNDYLNNDTTITTLRSVSPNEGIKYDLLPSLAIFDVRIKATGQLNGTLDSFNMILGSKLPVWNPSSKLFEYSPSDNPAWSMVHLLYGSQRSEARRISDVERYDTTKLMEWAEICEAEGWRINGLIDSTQTLYETIRNVASVGRGSLSMVSGKYSVAYDWYKETIRQIFTPRNSWGFESKKIFVKKTDAVDVTFKSKAEGYNENTIRVYNDNQTVETAKNVEKISLAFVNSEEQAYKQGRFHMADIELRPEVFTFSTDVENIVCKRGDRIRVVSDVLMSGLGQGYIDEVYRDEDGRITEVFIDSELVLEKDKQYGVNIRAFEGSVVEGWLEVEDEQVSTYSLKFAPPLSDNQLISGGELLTFGESDKGVGTDCVITKIEANTDLSATVSARAYAPEVFTADTEEIPPFDPQIQFPANPLIAKPSPPKWEGIVSDERVMILKPDGSLQTRAIVTLSTEGGSVPSAHLRLDYRFHPEDQLEADTLWEGKAVQPIDNTTFILYDLVDGELYDFRMCAISKYGVMSDWVQEDFVLVVGKTTPPPAVGEITVVGKEIRWTYPDKPIDFSGYKVRYGSSIDWIAGTDAHEGLLTDASFRIDNTYGTKLWMVKAVDKLGIESEGYSSITTSQIDNPVENILFEEHESPLFEGVIQGGDVVSGTLRSQTTSHYWRQTDEAFWYPSGSDFWGENEYNRMIYGFKPSFPSDFSGRHVLSLDSNIYPIIEYREYEGVIDVDAVTGWIPWSGELLEEDQSFDYYFRLTFPAIDFQSILEDAAWIIDAPTITEDLFSVNIEAVTGTVLPIKNQYSTITALNIMALYSNTTGTTVVVNNKDSLGPLVSVVNPAGEKVAGVIDVQVTGFNNNN